MNEINWVELNPPERRRTYCFPDKTLTFNNVVRVEVRQSGKHRIETADGVKAFIMPSWLWMEIDSDGWTF